MSKRAYPTVLLLILLTGSFWVFWQERTGPEQSKPQAPSEIETPKEVGRVIVEKAEVARKAAPPKEERIPEKSLIAMPFTTQAPFANWDERHEEACEEASLLMVAYFLKGKNLNRNIAEEELQKMIDFQIRNYGDYKDSNAQQIVQLAKDYFLIDNLKAVYDFPKEELRKELAKGNPVIILAAGRELGNPNFTGLGPPYHVLVAKGYDGDVIITNDPGTRKGEGYRYDIDVLYSAIHDFPGSKERIREGRKAMIVVSGDN